jgi:hypothetical protein
MCVSKWDESITTRQKAACSHRSDEHGQTSGHAHLATATPLGPPRAQTAQKQHAGLLELDAQPSAASIRLPEGAAPKVSAPVQVRRAYIPTPTRHRAPNQEPGRILIPGDGAAGDQGAQNRPACAAIVATRRLRPVPSQRFVALWCQAHTPSCGRQVTSTSVRMVIPGPAGAPRGHAPLRTDTLSLARTISDRLICASLMFPSVAWRREPNSLLCSCKAQPSAIPLRGLESTS